MCWLDKKAIEQFIKLRDKFNISQFVETGTFMGVNAKLHSRNFKEVLSCELIDEYFDKAKKRMEGLNNVFLFKKSSGDFLRDFIDEYKKAGRTDIVFFFLDAHFYNPEASPEDRWVVLKELKALKGFKNCIIVIHDFDNNLGHCVYDDEHLGLPLVKEDLMKVNPDFHLYTNELHTCDIITEEEVKEGKVPGLDPDFETLDNIRYAHSRPSRTQRGFLYAIPEKLDLKDFELRKVIDMHWEDK